MGLKLSLSLLLIFISSQNPPFRFSLVRFCFLKCTFQVVGFWLPCNFLHFFCFSYKTSVLVLLHQIFSYIQIFDFGGKIGFLNCLCFFRIKLKPKKCLFGSKKRNQEKSKAYIYLKMYSIRAGLSPHGYSAHILTWPHLQ